MTIDNLTASQREQLKITVLEDVLGHEPSWGRNSLGRRYCKRRVYRRRVCRSKLYRGRLRMLNYPIIEHLKI